MRVLHSGSNLLRSGHARRRPGKNARRHPRADERQHLPVRRLSEYRRGDPAGDAGCEGRNPRMKNFSFTRADGVATAVREVAADGKAKFIAGGTNLIDLMK